MPHSLTLLALAVLILCIGIFIGEKSQKVAVAIAGLVALLVVIFAFAWPGTR